MKYLFTNILLTVMMIIPLACATDDAEPSDTNAAEEMPLVVEGWIGEGEAPVVMVTHAIPLDSDVTDFSNVVERWCRVSVFEDDREYLLTGRLNDAYTPSLIYTSSRLKGKPGHTYRLLVETTERSAIAEATLRPAAPISRLEAVSSAEEPDKYVIRAFIDAPDPEGFYKLMVRVIDEEERFYPAFLGNFSGAEYDPQTGRDITRGLHARLDQEEAAAFSHYFEPGSTVMVQLCRIEPEVFDFWKVYDANVSLSSNMFFTFTADCPGNVGGAKGYWSPQGTSTAAIRIPASET